MKRYLIFFAAILLTATVVMPAFADVQFQYGGMFRWRFDAEDNVLDGTNTRFSPPGDYNSNDNQRYIDQRLRMYFRFSASENLKVFVLFQMGDAVWGQGGTSSLGRVGSYIGANVGADSVSVAVRNAYIQFNIPQTPSTATLGVKNLVLLDSWITDDELPIATLETKLGPAKVTLGYIGAQYGWERIYAQNLEIPTTDSTFNIDSVFAQVEYKEGPFSGTLIGFFQDGHGSDISINPGSYALRVSTATAGGYFDTNGSIDPASFAFTNNLQPRNNYLFDLGMNLKYKCDWLSAYVDFVKNLGSSDLIVPMGTTSSFHNTSIDYTGWMIDAGITYYNGPFTANLGGFYTSGPSISNDARLNGNTFNGLSSSNVNWFTYPLSTNKTFSEIIGGGVLGDNYFMVRGYSANVTAGNVSFYPSRTTLYWSGYGAPTNLWTITAGGSYQIDQKTKLSGSYWYFGTASAVPTQWDPNMFGGAGGYKMSSSIGHEFDVYLDRKIVENLTLTLVGAYLLADDAFCPLPVGFNPSILPHNAANVTNPLADNAFQVGARLQWFF